MTSRRATGIVWVACMGVASWGLGSRAEEQREAPKPVVAVFTLGGAVAEAPTADDLPFASAGESFYSLLTRLKKVRSDEAVKSVVLLVDDTSLGIPQIEEVRRVLADIQAAGKEVVAHADAISTRSYALISGANRLAVVPAGDVCITGVYSESLHLRGLLDLLGVTPDFTTCGAYKSAAEMFMRREPSPAARENLDWLMDGIYDSLLTLIATGRGVDVDQVRQWIDQGIYSAEQARAAGIIDAVQFRQDFEADLRAKYGADLVIDRRYGRAEPVEVDLSSPWGVLKFYGELLAGPKKKQPSEASVAIVYVDGPIVPGAGAPSGFPWTLGGLAFSTPIARALDQAAADDHVQAVVLRVDSPGGSAAASEIILNASRRVAARKPLVVSMGNVAGSGGYYVACAAPTIFADPATVTGSIGVVGGKLATQNMWDRVGINWAPVHRGQNAGMLNSGQAFSDPQRALLQSWMDEIYAVFKGHVVANRGQRLTKPIEELAGGRVYTGKQALALGLVDQLGGLDDAIHHAAQQANLTQYDVRVLPPARPFLEALLSDLQDGPRDSKSLLQRLGGRLGVHRALLEAALPQLPALEPRRLRSVWLGLWQLQQLHQERVLTAMPVIDLVD